MLKRVLIANRGEIALRIIRACRELDIETVAVYSTADENALHAQMATKSLCIGPAKAADSYLNQQALLSAAKATGCDALHPGYGFLSENPDFADLCVESGLKYIGPSGDVIRKMGSKAAARTLAQQAGVTFLASVPDGMLAATGDQSLLEQMLLELISNAIKAAGRDGQAGLKLSSTGRRALITVWDDGPGMDEGDLAALMGERASLHPPKPGSGLGLGLAVARHIARLHDGALLLESKPGQGLQATVSLPVRRAPRGELNTPIREPEGGYPALLTGLADALPWQAFLEEV